jgi:hypothetical protein
MRIIPLIIASLSFLYPKAQTYLPAGSMNAGLFHPFTGYNIPGDSSNANRKWYFSKYVGVSTGFSFYNGGSTTFFEVPVGMQLNHPLNNNLVAFAGVYVAPSFYSFNNSFMNSSLNKSYPGNMYSNAYGFNVNSRVEMGLMYINDAKTFSISGSIGVERSSYPVFPTNGVNTKRQLQP